MKKNLLLTLCFIAVSFIAMAGKFIMIPVSETNNLESLFNNKNLTIHYYCDSFVLASAETINIEETIILDEEAFGDVHSYSIVYCFDEQKEEYLARISGSVQTLYSGEHFFIMKQLSDGFMSAKNDGMVTIQNTEARLPKLTFDFPVITEPDETILALMGQVNTDRLIGDVQHLQDFETRFCSHPTSLLAQNWLQNQFESLGLSTTIQSATCHSNGPWWGGSFQSGNVIAVQLGTELPNEFLVCGSHFDTFAYNGSWPYVYYFDDAPGSDDNATGTAGILETARILSQYSFKRSIIYCTFTAEECGLDGSKCYAEQCASQGMNIIGYFNIDMSGYLQSGTNMHIDLIHPTSATPLANYYINVANIYASGIPVTSYPNLPGGDSDHTSFNNNGFMGIFPFEDRNNHSPFIHTSNDLIGNSVNNPEQVNLFTKLNLAGIATLAEFDGEAPPPLAPPVNCAAEYVEEMSIQITWETPLTNSPNEYYVYRDQTKICATTELLYTDVVEDFKEYCYTVIAVYEQGVSNPSNQSCASVPYPFAPPTNCVATWVEEEANINNNILVTWYAPAEVTPYEYFVYRDEVKINQTTDTHFMDALNTTGEYCYKIAAVYEGGESNFSNQSCEVIPIIDGIYELSSKYFIYPNPAKNELQITNYELGITNVEIFDIYGRNLSSNHLIPTSSNHLINISHLPAGVYFIKISNTFVGKFVKE